MNGRCDVVIGEDPGGLADDVTDAVTDEDFHCDSRISFFCVGKVNDRSGDSVCDLVGVGGGNFFKHSFFLLSFLFFSSVSFYIRSVGVLLNPSSSSTYGQ